MQNKTIQLAIKLKESQNTVVQENKVTTTTTTTSTSNQPLVEKPSRTLPNFEHEKNASDACKIQEVNVQQALQKALAKKGLSVVGLGADENNLAPNLGVSDVITKESTIVLPLGVLTQDSPAIIQAKYAIQHFVQGLKRFKNDEMFIKHWIEQIDNNPGFMTRAFQVAFEITFHKRRFSDEEILDIFGGTIGLYKVGDQNNTMDSSTLYSIFQTYHVLKQQKFEGAVVISPPVNTADLNKMSLSPKEQALMVHSQKATGNTLCDTRFKNHYYDYKSSGNFKFTKNHVIFVDYNEIVSNKSVIFLKNLLSNLELSALEGSRDKVEIEYLNRAIKKLTYVIQDKGSTNLQKLDEWNVYVFSTLERRPVTIFFPCLISTNNTEITKDMVNGTLLEITFPLKKALETFDLKKILNEIYSRMTPQQFKDVSYIIRGVYDLDDQSNF